MLERLLRRWIPRERLGSGLILSVIRLFLAFLLVVLLGYAMVRSYVISEYQTFSNLKSIQSNVLLLEKALIDQETGQRGYVLTGDGQFLEPFNTGTTQYNQLAKTLSRQTGLTPDLQTLLQQLIQAGDAWHNNVSVPQVQRIAAGGQVSTADLVNGKSAFDNFRASADHFNTLLSQQQEQEHAHMMVSINLILIGLSVVTMLIGGYLISLIVRRFQKMITPINALAEVVSSYSERDFDQAVPLAATTEGEMVRLMDGVDLMRTELKRYFLAEQRRTQLSKTLIHLQDGFSREVEFSVAAKRLTEELHRFTDADHVAVLEIQNDLVRVVGSSGMDIPLDQWFRLSDTSLPKMISGREPFIRTNSNPNTLDNKINELVNDRLGVRASVHLPLFAENKCFALVHFSWRHPIEVTEEERFFYEELLSLLSSTLWSALMWTRVQQLAARDGLTGIWNRRYFDEGLQQSMETARRKQRPLCLLLFDVDRFKLFNDNYGHLEGDRVLRHIAGLLENFTRPQDIGARYGGEEFALVLPETSLDEGKRIAERLRTLIQSNALEPYEITASFGVAELLPEEDAHSLIERADQMLYRAKEQGRNCVVACKKGNLTTG